MFWVFLKYKDQGTKFVELDQNWTIKQVRNLFLGPEPIIVYAKNGPFSVYRRELSRVTIQQVKKGRKVIRFNIWEEKMIDEIKAEPIPVIEPEIMEEEKVEQKPMSGEIQVIEGRVVEKWASFREKILDKKISLDSWQEKIISKATELETEYEEMYKTLDSTKADLKALKQEHVG